MAERDATGRFKSSQPDEMQRIEVAQAAGLDATMAPRLKGATLEELTADAAELAGVVGRQAPTETTQRPASMNDVIRQGIAHRQGAARERFQRAGLPVAPDPATAPPTTGGGFDGGAHGGSSPPPSMNDAIRDAFGRR
jgi:hypothetical protein